MLQSSQTFSRLLFNETRYVTRDKDNATYTYVILRAGHEASEGLTEELKAHVGHEMGPIARPEKITIVPQLPKTRSGKIMRSVLRARAQGLPEGDISTLEE